MSKLTIKDHKLISFDTELRSLKQHTDPHWGKKTIRNEYKAFLGKCLHHALMVGDMEIHIKIMDELNALQEIGG